MFLLLFTVLVVIVTTAAILVRKNKYLVFLVIASGLAVVIAFLVALKHAITYTM